MFQKLPDQWSPQLLFRIMIKIVYLIQIGYVHLMVIVSMRPHAEIGRNDHLEGAPHFMSCWAHFLVEIARVLLNCTCVRYI